jgi:hypothetical protein
MYLQIFIPTILAILAYILGRFRDNNKQIFDKKLEIYSNIVIEISQHRYLKFSNQTESDDLLIRLFAPVRLIGGDSVVDEILEYFSLVCEYFNSVDDKTKKQIINKISKSAMDLEQLMRKDLGKKRVLTKMEIFFHNMIKK